jgi:hypothetical protein
MWALVVRRCDDEPELVLLTTIPITNAAQAQLAFEQWRMRPAIEHTYRFEQEQGLDVEDMRVRSSSGHASAFRACLADRLLCRSSGCHLASLGWRGKLGLKTNLDGLNLLLAGISFVFTTAATLSFARAHPFPFFSLTYG